MPSRWNVQGPLGNSPVGNELKTHGGSIKTKEPSGTGKGGGGFLFSDFPCGEPHLIGVGRRFGRDAQGKLVAGSPHKNASAVASNSTASSTRGALRAAARRSAVMASLFTLRGIPLVA